MTDSAYKRGYDAARDELARQLAAHNNALNERCAELMTPKSKLVDALGVPLEQDKQLSDYERGVIAGAIAETRTIMMFLGHTDGEGTAKLAELNRGN